MKQLPPGQQQDRTRLWDRQYRLLWDSATASEPAYKYINTWVHATIDKSDGTTRWSGQFYRSPVGVQRWSYDDLTKITIWPNPIFEDADDVA